MQCACAMLSSVACPALRNFQHYFKNGTIFIWGGGGILNTKRVFWFSLKLLPEIFLVLRRTERDMIKNVYWFYVKYPLFLSHFNATWIFSTDLRKILKYQISWESVQWQPSCSMQTDGQTDATKLVVAFRNFANASENCSVNRQQNGGFYSFTSSWPFIH